MIPVVVLVRTHSPGNLGGCARACRCFGAELVLLDPRADRAHEDARSFASGAEALLDAAEVLEGWGRVPALADRLVALTAARGRVARGLPPAERFADAAAYPGRVALVFGPERGGLTTAELRLCDATLTLPTAPDFPTLSLPQSVAAALALLSEAPPAPAPPLEARSEELSRALSILREELREKGWAAEGRSETTIYEFESLLKRARPTAREVTLLTGMLAALRRR